MSHFSLAPRSFSHHYLHTQFYMLPHRPRRPEPPTPSPPPEVTWRPPQTRLHYNALYYGIYEYLRAPPDAAFLANAQAYLASLIRSRGMLLRIDGEYVLQCDRILWVQEWIKAVPFDTDACSDADTVDTS
jgi:hypothetical protein